jgi:RND family efflux transporter MFP subunit
MKRKKIIYTSVVLFIALLAVTYKYWDYLNNPWTRDGQVRAQVIKITPRVSGPIVNLPIVDNQFVKAGDLFFEIDPSIFKADLDNAKANVAVYKAKIIQFKMQINQAKAHIEYTKANYERYKEMFEKGATSQRQYQKALAEYKIDVSEIEDTKAQLVSTQASLAQSKAKLKSAELNLQFTKVKAPVDGYVTNLNLRLGSQAVMNQPALALVDVNSYWVDGFFRENDIANIKKGDQAVLSLMTYPRIPIKGKVISIGWGIAQDDGSTGDDLLPNINPSFEWILLAQRVPVSIQLIDVPQEVELRVGTTASVMVRTGTSEKMSDKKKPSN